MCIRDRVGRLIDSKTLIATAADSRNDVISTTAVLAASLLSHFTSLELDGWMGLAVAVFILYSGFGLVRDTLDPLLGRAPDPRLVAEIRGKILGYPGVLGTHDLMIHDYGPGRQFGSVHVEMAAEQDVLVSHEMCIRDRSGAAQAHSGYFFVDQQWICPADAGTLRYPADRP